MSKPLDIHARRAVNAEAGKSFSKGIEYDWERKVGDNAVPHWEAPPPCYEYHRLPWSTRRNVPNLIGTHRGRMRIVGLLEYKAGGGVKWLAKCACGHYELRNHTSGQRGLKNGAEDKGCYHCIQTDYLRRKNTQGF